MRKINMGIVSTLFITLATAACSPDSETNKTATVSAAEQQTMQEVTNTSFQTVVPAMMKLVSEKVQSEGAAAAVAFCNENVAGMGKEMKDKLEAQFKASNGVSDFSFGRTTLKLRNPKNKPDAVMEEVLKTWLDQEQQGGKAEMVVRKSGDMLYGMKPIRIVSPTCLKCHGTDEARDAEATKVIAERYPQDAAVDYKEDELRGAFWVKARLN